MKLIAFRAFLFYHLVLGLSLTYGQEKVGEIVNDHDFDIKKSTDLLILKDPTDSLKKCLFAINGRQILAQEFDNNYQTITSHTYDKLYDLQFPNLIGGIYAEKKSILIYANGRNKSFNALSVDNERKFLVNKEIKIGKDEIFLESFESGKHFYLVTVGWKKSYLVFYRITTELIVETYKVELNDYKFGNTETDLYNNLIGTSNDIDVSKISYETINSLGSSFNRAKIYTFDDTFVLTLDKLFGQTLILKINLLSWDAELLKFKVNDDDCNKSKSNSFLYFNTLFKTQVCDDRLLLSILNVDTKEIINRYEAKSSEEIEFNNTPITQEGGNTIYVANDSRELKNANSLFRKIHNSQISVAANLTKQCGSCFEVTIGSFEEKEIASGGVPSYTGGTSVPMGGSMIPVQGGFSPTYYGYTKSTWAKSAFFKTLLQGDNFSHKPGEIYKNDFDLIEKYTETNESKIITKTVFYKAGKYYLAYYNKDSKSLIVMKF